MARRGPAGALPATDVEHLWDRVWLGWQELARDDDALAHTVTEARRREQGLLAHAVWPERCVGHRWTPRGPAYLTSASTEVQEVVLAQVTGLRALVCARGDRLPIGRADATLGTFLASLSQVSAWPVFCATIDGSG